MDFKQLFEGIQAALVVISPEYKVLAATDRYLEITMRTREDLIGTNFLEAFPDNPDDPGSKNTESLKGSLDRARITKKLDHFPVMRYDIPRPEEMGGGFDIRYWEATHKPVLDENGEVLYVIQKTTDVTEREIAKLALSEIEDKFRFTVDCVPQLIDTTDAEGRSTYFNQRWVSYTGIPLKELLHGKWRDAMHPDDLPMAEKKWEEAAKKGTAVQFDARIKRKDGSYRWFSTQYQPMMKDDDNVSMWIGSCTDIDDTKRLVDELLYSNEEMVKLSDQLQQSYRQAEDERKKLENLIMQSPALFCILEGPDHRYELVNPVYQQLFPKRQLVGRTVAEALPEVVDQGIIEILDEVYTTGKEFVANEMAVKLDKYDKGKPEDVYLNFIYQPIYTDEKITGILVFAYDVTQQVMYKKKLEEMDNVS